MVKDILHSVALFFNINYLCVFSLWCVKDSGKGKLNNRIMVVWYLLMLILL